MTIDVIFLGIDGVLFDTDALHLAACNSAFAEAGLDTQWTLHDLRKAVRTHGYAGATGALQLAPSKSRRDVTAAELVEMKQRALHQAILAKPIAALPAALRLVDEASRAGCKISILSDMAAASTGALLEQCFGSEVNSLFAVVSGGANWQGPAGTGPFARALLAIGADAGSAIAIDTAPAALRAARACGLWTVSACPNDLGEASISGADLWCPQLQELRQLVPGTQAPQPVSLNALRGLKANRLRGRLNLPVPAQSVF
jgi:beta-phosphoglucomutase